MPSDTKHYFAIRYIGLNGQSSLISDNIVSVRAWPGFQDNNDATLTDLRTNLVWLKDASSSVNNFGASSTQGEAIDFVAGQNNGWRMANYKELASVFGYNFENIAPETYWSKNYFMVYQAGFPGDVSRYIAWNFNFQNGAVGSEAYDGGGSSLYRFLATKGNEIPGGPGSGGNLDIVDNNDGIIQDNRTGLMWLNANFALYDGNSKNWADTFRFASNAAFCNDGTLQGNENTLGDCSGNGGVKYDDWRLANVQEMLESYGVLSWRKGAYWTGSIFDENNFWVIAHDYYSVGMPSYGDKNNYRSVQLVRDP